MWQEPVHATVLRGSHSRTKQFTLSLDNEAAKEANRCNHNPMCAPPPANLCPPVLGTIGYHSTCLHLCRSGAAACRGPGTCGQPGCSEAPSQPCARLCQERRCTSFIYAEVESQRAQVQVLASIHGAWTCQAHPADILYARWTWGTRSALTRRPDPLPCL